MDCAVDTMMQERVDSYFRVEQGLDEIVKSLLRIEEELQQICDLSGAMRLESRLEFVEDRWDDLDSEIRERPRRRRRKISLATCSRGGRARRNLSQGSGVNNRSMVGHYGESSALLAASRSLRHRQIAPSCANNGDRSSERELRPCSKPTNFSKSIEPSNTEHDAPIALSPAE